MLLTVCLNVKELLGSFEAILTKKAAFNLDSSQLICGMTPEDYANTLRFTKMQCLSALPLIYRRLESLALPFMTQTLPGVAQSLIKNDPNSIRNLPEYLDFQK